MTTTARFRRAWGPDGLPIEAFDQDPPTARTLCAVIGSDHGLLQQGTDATIPNPDIHGS